jgi:predicted Zn-dependent peptidase
VRRQWAATLALVIGLAWAALLAPHPADAEVSRHVLDNGLILLVRENTAAPAVAASIFVRVGSLWESEGNAGISNLLQQVLVKGTSSRSGLEIADEAERLGGSLTASGEADYCEVRGVALSRYWRRLLALMADVVLNPALAPEEIENERRSVSSGLRNRRDQPFPFSFDTLMTRLFPGHPYGVPVLGRPETLARLDRDALVAHYRRYYTAGRIVVSVSGDVTRKEVVMELGRLFAVLPREGEGRETSLPPVVAAYDRLVMTRPAAQAQVLMGFLAPPMGHPDYGAVKVLQTALGGGMAGRLFTELRDRQGLAYSTGALFPARINQSFLVAHIGTAPANVERSEERMRQQIARMSAERLSDSELTRAKAYLLGQFDLDRRTNARLAWYAAFFEVAGVGQGFAEDYARAVEAVTADEVQRVARVYLSIPTVVRLEPSPR